MTERADKRNRQIINYLKTEGKPWMDIFLEISRGLQIIARRKMPFIRYSVIYIL